ncbi:MAG: hypothetical protein WCO58_00235 [bacterium]
MFYAIDKTTGVIRKMNDKKEFAPFDQYKNNVNENTVLVSVVGKNKLAKVMQNVIEIHAYDLKASQRMMHLIITIGEERFIKFNTNLKMIPSSEALDLLLPNMEPLHFLKMLCDIEKEYSADEKIDHTPWLEGFLERQHQNSKIKTWGNVIGKTPQMFNDSKNDAD